MLDDLVFGLGVLKEIRGLAAPGFEVFPDHSCFTA